MKRAHLLILFIIPYLMGLPESAHSGHIVRSPCKVIHPSDKRIQWECRKIKKGETLEGLFGEMWIDVARFNRIDRRHIYPGISIKVPKRLEDIRNFSPMPLYYEPAKDYDKFILIDLSE